MNTKQIIKKELINSFKHQLQRSLEVDIHILEFLDLAELANLARERLVAADRRHTIRSKLSRKITKAQEKVQELICKVFLVASDAQTVTGMLCIAITCGWQTCILLLIYISGAALIIAAMIQQKSLSLYHLHVIYDTVNFTT